jgi:multiple sugar transport system substrate-binding protein
VVLPIPQFDTEKPKMISQGPSLCIFNKEDPQEVLASWLFAQYLLTNEVQIAYAQTEGYVPVTEKAQKSAEYTDYLARAGEDHDLYYDVKLDATKLLLENTENTFVTPVFDGSASLRNAAGQMIESVVKSVMRKEKIDAAYYEKLYGEMISLYKLDSFAGTKQALGPMPMTSKLLLAGLAVIWCGILGYIFTEKVKNSKKRT